MAVVKIKRSDGTWYEFNGHLPSEIVSSLPTGGEVGKLYLINIEDDVYQGYIWKDISGTYQWIQLGSTGGSGGSVDDVKVNGTSVVDVNRVANVTMPTALSDLSEDSTHKVITEAERQSWTSAATNSHTHSNKSVLDEIDAGDITSWDSKAELTDIPQIVDNVTSTDTTKTLSAKQGKLLNDRIDNLSSIGKFLSIWDATTGLPTTNPATLPYTYHTGDYYRVGTISATTNYKPSGSAYTGAASTSTISSVGIGDVFYYDGTNWMLQTSSSGGTVQDVTVNGTSVVSSGIAVVTTPTKTSDLTNDSGFLTQHQSLSAYRTSAAQDIIDATKISDVKVNGTSVVSSGTAVLSSSSTPASGGTDFFTTGGAYTELAKKADTTDIPTKTSDLTNDSNFAVDGSYVHTDNNYTTTEKNKLSGIAAGAEVNVQSDWEETDTQSDAYIQNKPDIKTTPTEGSSDLITSGGVYTALQSKQDTLPAIVSNRYLHTNSTSGDLEWSTVEESVTDVTLDGTSVVSSGVAALKSQIVISSSQPSDPDNELWLDTTASSTVDWDSVIGYASSSQAGLAKAIAKTSSMTQQVGIDASTGQLYVASVAEQIAAMSSSERAQLLALLQS